MGIPVGYNPQMGVTAFGCDTPGCPDVEYFRGPRDGMTPRVAYCDNCREGFHKRNREAALGYKAPPSIRDLCYPDWSLVLGPNIALRGDMIKQENEDEG